MSFDFQISIQQGGRGAKKRLIEGTPEPAEPKKIKGRIPRISRYMALAIHFEDLIRRGIVADYAELARLGHVTRARVTQIMNLRLLAPEIQEYLLNLDCISDNCPRLTLKCMLNYTRNLNWSVQRRSFGGR